MFWFILSLGSALCKSLSDVASKQVMAKMGEIAAGCVARGLVAMIALIIVLIQGFPTIGPGFWKAALISGGINIITTVLTLRALKNGELSLVAPILALSPIFLLVTSPIINNQFPTIGGLIGIIVSVSGLYTMKVQEKKAGWLAPFKAVWRSAGAKEALLVAFLYSISANYDSIGSKASSPFFFIMSVNLIIFLSLLLPALKKEGFFRLARENGKRLSLMSIFMAGETGLQFTAFQYAIVPYVISIKRTSALFSVIWGGKLFKEGEFKERFAGALLVVAGLAIIKIFG